MIQVDEHACKLNVTSDPCVLGYAGLILDGVVGTA